MKLIKFLIKTGIGSRRKCTDFVDEGLIQVNGLPAKTIFQEVSDSDEIKYKNRLLRIQDYNYYILNKPKHYICANSDKYYSKLVINLFPRGKRLFTVGRLDKNTTGLLLVTNDGDFANEIIHPSKKIIKSYNVVLDGKVQFNDIKFSKHHKKELGEVWFRVHDLDHKMKKNTELNSNGDSDFAWQTSLRFDVVEGKNHIVKKFFNLNGFTVIDLERIAIGGLNLANLGKKLRPGQFKEVEKDFLAKKIFEN